MFVGLHHHVFDGKGRIAFPAPLRASLNEQGAEDRFYLTISFYEPCLQVNTEEDFRMIADKVRALPPSNPAVSEFKRVVIASATLVSIDKAGRVSVPKELRDYASLERDAVWAGVIDKIELWSKARWDDRTAKRLQDRQFLDEARKFFEPHGI